MNAVNTQIRILYDIFIGIFMLFIGILPISIFKVNITYEISLIFIVELVVLQLLYKKKCLKNGDYNKKILITGAMCIVILPIIYILFSNNIYIILGYNALFILALMLTRSFSWEIYAYGQYVIMLKVYVGIEFLSLITLQFLNKMAASYFTIFLMISLIISIVILRQSRNLENGIISKFEWKFNIVIIAISALSLTKCFENICSVLIKSLYKLSQFIFDVVMKVLLWMLSPIINFLQRHIGIKKVTKSTTDIIKDLTDKVDEKDQFVKLESISRQQSFQRIWGYIINVLTVIVIILCLIVLGVIIYRIIKKVKSKDSTNISHEYYEIEKIPTKSKKKKRILPDLVGNSNEVKVRKTYIQFLKFANNKKSYKPYMTPTAIANAMKTKVDAFRELDNIKDIYNEAKFSKHDISNDKVSDIRSDCKEVINKNKHNF